jgi:hypothetical protein
VPGEEWGKLANWMDDVGGRVRHMFSDPNAAIPPSGAGVAATPARVNDPLSPRHRWQLALLVSVIAPLAATLVSGRTTLGTPINAFFFVFTAMWGAALGLFFAHRAIVPKWGVADAQWLPRLIAGQCAALGLVILSLPTWATGPYRGVGGTLFAIIAPLCLFSTRDQTAWNRPDRVSGGHLFGAGFAAFILAMIFQGHWQIAVAVAVGVSLVVQILAPWDPTAGARAKKIKDAIEKAEEEGDEDKVEQLKAAAAAAQNAPPVAPARPMVHAVAIDARNGTVRAVSPHAAAEKVKEYAQANYGKRRGGRKRVWSRPVWPPARVAWIAGIVIFLTMGVMFCVAGANTRRPDEVGPYVAAGVSAFIFGLLCIIRALTTVFYGWWGYLVKPVVMTACLSSIASSAIVLGNLWYPAREDDILLGTFFMIFPALLLVVMLFIPGKWPDTPPQQAFQPVTSTGPSPYQRRWAMLLSLFALAGFAGLQRIYVGKLITGIIWLITWGLFGFGQLVDVIMILSGDFTDKRGRKLKYWEAPGSQFAAAPAPPPPIPPDAPGAPEPAGDHGIAHAVECVVADCTDAVAGAFKDVGATFKATIGGWRRPSGPDAFASASAEQPQLPRRDLAIDINLRGLLSALAGLLLFIATLLALGLAIDVPGMLYHGVPTMDIKRELEAHAFAQFPDTWPQLLSKMAAVCIGVIMLLALTIQAFARQRGGVIHMIRGIVGAVGLMVAMLPLSVAVATHARWKDIGLAMSQKAYDAAADPLLKSFQSWPAIGAGAIFLVSVMLLAWPARRAKDASSSSAYYPIDPSQPGASATVKGA